MKAFMYTILVFVLTLLALQKVHAGGTKKPELGKLPIENVGQERPRQDGQKTRQNEVVQFAIDPQRQSKIESLSQCEGDLPANLLPGLEVILTELLDELENRYIEKAKGNREFKYSITRPDPTTIEKISRFIEAHKSRFPLGKVIQKGSFFGRDPAPITLQLIPTERGNHVVLYPQVTSFASGEFKDMKIAIDLSDADLLYSEGHLVAVISPRKGSFEASTVMQREYKVLEELQGLGVIKLPHFNKEAELFTQKLYNGVLSDYLFGKKDFGSFENQLRVGIGITEGLDTIHRKGYSNRDLKPDNVLIQKDSRQKFVVGISDFGTALSQRHTVNRVSGTPLYFAPETFQADDQGPEGDNWALGIILHFLLREEKKDTDWEKLKYYDETKETIKNLTTYKDIDRLFGTECIKRNSEIAEIVCGLLHPKKAMRWTSARALAALKEVYKKNYPQVTH